MSGTDTAGVQNQIPNFEAMIRDIDDAINTEPVFSNSKAGNSESLLAINDKDLHFGSNGSTIKDMGSPIQLLGKEEDKLTNENSRMSPMQVKFEMGRADIAVEGKANKHGPKKIQGGVKIMRNVNMGQL